MGSGQPENADTTTREQRQRRMRRVQLAMAALATCMGLVNLSGVAGNPRFETYHGLDVARLILAGVAFGVALVLVIQFIKFSGAGSEAK
jgi:hypothetical protein